MPSYTPANQLPYPLLTEPPNGPDQIKALATAIDSRAFPRYADAAGRDAAITAPVQGQHAWLDNPGFDSIYKNGSWQIQYQPVWVSATASVNIPANQNYGIGNVAVSGPNSSSVLTGGLDSLVSVVPGILIFSALYYMPNGGAWRNASAQPPGENPQAFLVDLPAGGSDRGTLPGVSRFTAAAQKLIFAQRSNAAINSCTFNLRGVFYPQTVPT